MQREIAEINRLQKEWQSLSEISQDNQKRLDKKFRLEFSYNSNHIEGNTLTYGETELLLIFDKTEGSHEMREYEEMKNHDVAYTLIQEWAADKEHPLTETYIKQLNEIILVKPFWKEAQTQDGQETRRLIKVGEYKEYPNSVRLQNGEIFEYASPIDTPIKMGELIQWYNDEVKKQELHPIILAALLHYKFVCIHPFDDGNGRLSRLLMNYVLLKNNLPPIIIKTLDKKSYLSALNKADVGNVESFIKYIAEQLIWSLQLVIKATKGENIEEESDWEKKLNLLKKSNFGSDELQEKYSEERAEEIFVKSIIPMLKRWEEKVKKFDAFFYERSNALETNNDFDLFDSFDEIIENIYSMPKLCGINFSVDVYFKGLRNTLNKAEQFPGGSLTFRFYTNNYEISTSLNKIGWSKLYHQDFSESELEKIVNDLVKWFYATFEKAIEKKKN